MLKFPLSAEYASNLARMTRRTLIDEERELDMGAFGRVGNSIVRFPSSMHACATNCCLLGYGAIEFPDLSANYSCWGAFSRAVVGSLDFFANNPVGHRPDVREWDFLFNSGWPDRRKETAARVLQFLHYGVDSAFPRPGRGERVVDNSTNSYLARLGAACEDLRYADPARDVDYYVSELEKFITDHEPT